MSESFIHYVWQYQYFNKTNLLTTAGEAIHIFSPGTRNSHAGPDFLNAKVKLGDIQWVGSVEIHIDASGWNEHKHQFDAAYDNVILHVVWEENARIVNSAGQVIPTLELKNRVDLDMITRYKMLMSSVDEIACAAKLPGLRRITLFSALDRMLSIRLENKALEVEEILKANRGDWEETCYQILARNFGFKVNAEAFFRLAQLLPYKTLMKHSDKLMQIESMLFGVAGFLEDNIDNEYYRSLQKEFHLLRRKYKLDAITMKKVQWKFLRLRPANFPTIRIAQFASYLHYRQNIFSAMLNCSFEKLREDLDTPPSSFWQRHYNFSNETHNKDAELGQASIDNIMINTIVPLNVCYSRIKDDEAYMERALRILYAVPSESNVIIKKWSTYSVKSRNAFDSQALLELYNNFCSRHRCLDCNIGASLVKPA
jgi:hypothetical protein